MVFEKYLQKFLGLRLALYDGGTERGPGIPVEESTQKKVDTNTIMSAEWIKKLTPQQQDELRKIIEKLNELKDKRDTAEKAKEVLEVQVKILELIKDPRVFTREVGSEEDKVEYDDMIMRLERKKQELNTYQQQSTSLIEEIDKLILKLKEFEQVSKTITGFKSVLKGTKDSDFIFDERQSGQIVGLKEGVSFTLDISKITTGSTTLGKIIPKQVLQISVGDKIYKRLGAKGEFYGEDNKLLDTNTVGQSQIKVLKNGVDGGANETVEKLKPLIEKNIDKALETELKKYPKLDQELVKEALINELTNADSCMELMDQFTDEAKFSDIITGKVREFLIKNEKAEDLQLSEGQDEKINALNRYKKAIEDIENKEGLTKLKVEIEAKRKALEGLRAKLLDPKVENKEELQRGVVQLEKEVTKGDEDINLKLSQIDGMSVSVKNEKNEDKQFVIKDLRKEIVRIEKELTAPGISAIRRYPTTLIQRASEKPASPLAQMLNKLFKAFLGIDFLQLNQQERQSYSDIISGEGSMQLGSLSERYESGGRGPDAITANDAGLGFPSYGTYQMNRDTLRDFAAQNGIEGNYLEVGDNTPFAQNWKKKVLEIGKDKFKALEHAFAKKVYFDKQVSIIENRVPGLKVEKTSLTFQNVIWSVAVQHGQNGGLFSEVANKVIREEKIDITKWDKDVEEKIINAIYAERSKRFPSLKVIRFDKELGVALTQLRSSPGVTDGSGEIPAGLKMSVGMEFKKEGGRDVSTCSRTTIANAAQYGLDWHLYDEKGKKLTPTAMQAEKHYRSKGEITNQLPTERPDARFADIYSESTGYPEYGHRALAINHGGKWFVLDPYLKIDLDKRDRNAPIPLARYLQFLQQAGRPFRGARYIA